MLTKTNKTLKGVKLVFGLALLFFIGWKIQNSEALDEVYKINLTQNGAVYLLLAVLLMPFNWLLETIKWKLLMRNTQELNWKGAFLSVLAGISTGLMTPNKIGNFIGRNIYVDKDLKRRATFVTLQANLAQFLATVIFGLTGLAMIGLSQLQTTLFLLESLAFMILLIAVSLYMRPSLLGVLIPDKWLNQKNKEAIDTIQKTTVTKKVGALILSLLRYTIFLTQFFLLIQAFEQTSAIIFAAISVVFLLTTLVPSVLFGKLFVREASALFVLTEFGIGSSIVLITVFILWCLNLALPAIFGSLILIRSK